jgi:hypothetical protein
VEPSDDERRQINAGDEYECQVQHDRHHRGLDPMGGLGWLAKDQLLQPQKQGTEGDNQPESWQQCEPR